MSAREEAREAIRARRYNEDLVYIDVAAKAASDVWEPLVKDLLRIYAEFASQVATLHSSFPAIVSVTPEHWATLQRARDALS